MASQGRKILIGCLAGCGGLLLLAIGSCVGFVIWLNAPGDVLEPARLVDPASTGYAEWTLRLEDPGTAEIVALLLAYARDLRESVPTPLPRGLARRLLELQDRQGRRKVERLFPIVLAWTMHPASSDAADGHLFSASFRGADHQLRLFDWILGFLLRRVDDRTIVRHGNETIVEFPTRGESGPRRATFIHHGDLFLATDLATARRVIDRLDAPADLGGTAHAALETWLALAPQQPLRGAIDNGTGAVERVWRGYDPSVDERVGADSWAALEAATFGGSFTADGGLVATLDLHFADAPAATFGGTVFGPAVERLVLGTPATLRGFEIDGRTMRATLEITDIVGQLEAAVQAALANPPGDTDTEGR